MVKIDPWLWVLTFHCYSKARPCLSSGIFLATGNSDSVVRVYCMAQSVPEKICELEAHTDRVDSIQYSHQGDRFISGSKDGTARIWYFRASQWQVSALQLILTSQ